MKYCLNAEWHANVCQVLPALTIIEHRCDNAQCTALHAIEFSLGWLWGSISFSIILDDDLTPPDYFSL